MSDTSRNWVVYKRRILFFAVGFLFLLTVAYFVSLEKYVLKTFRTRSGDIITVESDTWCDVGCGLTVYVTSARFQKGRSKEMLLGFHTPDVGVQLQMLEFQDNAHALTILVEPQAPNVVLFMFDRSTGETWSNYGDPAPKLVVEKIRRVSGKSLFKLSRDVPFDKPRKIY